jgi:hypothetical protein
MSDVTPELAELKSILSAGGLHEVLRFLNDRTPHRYTGVYRYDGDVLRNVCLFDRFEPQTLRGDDIALEDAYCSIVKKTGNVVEFSDARTDGRIPYKPQSPVISYCGVLLRDPDGKAFGALCHFDTAPCQPRIDDVPLLEAAGPLLVAAASVTDTECCARAGIAVAAP